MPGPKYLFLDDEHVETRRQLTRAMHQPIKRGPLVVPDRPSDGRTVEIRDAPFWVPDERAYRMYYLREGDGESGTAFARSPDGLSWEKPAVGRARPDGSSGSNIIDLDEPLHWRVNWINGVIFDPDDPNPERRYKAFLGALSRQPIVSADGFAWRRLPVPPIESQDESQHTHDRARHRFLAIVKRPGPNGRSFYLATSGDFEHWDEHGLIFHADERDQELAREVIAARLVDEKLARPIIVDEASWGCDVYNMAIFPYEGLYVGLPAFFYHSGPVGRNYDGFHHIQLAVSRDLHHWDRLGDRTAFIGPSPVEGGAYDTMQLLPSSRPIERGDELWFYYTGLRTRFNPLRVRPDGTRRPIEELTDEERTEFATGAGAVCLAVLRRDGFVSLDAGEREGNLTTKPLTLDGSGLYLNLEAPEGEARVQVVDTAGASIPGFGIDDCHPVTGDGCRLPVTWTGGAGIGALGGRTVRLEIRARRASLYAFWAE